MRVQRLREIRNKNLSKQIAVATKDNTQCQKAKKGFTMKKTTSGYSVNFADNTITLTKAFAQRAKNPSTAEFRELAKLTKNFPNLTITMRTAVITADKNTHDGLTIARMEFLIKNYMGDEIALAEFAEVQKFYKGTKGYYGKVKGWFLNKYPNYKNVDFEDIATSQKPEEKASATPELAIAG